MSRRPLRVLVVPRDDNPYYRLLYGAFGKEAVAVTYLDGPTGSQTVNLALAPLLLAAYRARGYRLLHLHWLYKFVPPWASGRRASRAAMQWWFGVYLAVAQGVGLRIVWTAHDLVPHEPLFLDDDRARSTLLSRCELIVALSPTSARRLLDEGARSVRTIPLGSYATAHATTVDRVAARAALGFGDDDFLVVWFGKVGPYKGVDRLLAAAQHLPLESPVRILVAGECSDDRYRAALSAQARHSGGRATAHLERLHDDELGALLVAADLAAFPFREITNSSSVMTALSFGVPVLVPDLPLLGDLPTDCTLRCEPAADDLAAALGRAAALSGEERAAMSEAARAFAGTDDWSGAAAALLDAYLSVLDRR